MIQSELEFLIIKISGKLCQNIRIPFTSGVKTNRCTKKRTIIFCRPNLPPPLSIANAEFVAHGVLECVCVPIFILIDRAAIRVKANKRRTMSNRTISIRRHKDK